MSPYPPHKGSSQPPGNKRTTETSQKEEGNGTDRSVRARSILGSSLPRFSRQFDGHLEQGRKEVEPDTGSGPRP